MEVDKDIGSSEGLLDWKKEFSLRSSLTLSEWQVPH